MEATLRDIAAMLCDFVQTPRQEQEIVAHLRDMGIDPTLASNMPAWAAAHGYIAIAPGTCGKRWTTKAKVRQMQEADE